MPRVPRISVVVPIYNVEAYLPECLDSILAQTVEDLEVILVDDGATDGSVAIAEAYAADDPRIRIVRQPNGGLGKARNTGADAATGEFLAFVDGDDVLPPRAYESLLRSLEESGSDFATGNVHRLSGAGTQQSRFLERTFTRNRRRTHVTRFRPLIADRIVPNKLWRRTFWDRHGFRFPEGMLHEDIPVVVPAQFAAEAVDVVAAPVYLWRIREGGDPSITQRRLERRALLDRLTAVEMVSDHLAESGQREGKRWYDESALADDLRYHLNLLDIADEAYRGLFLDHVNAFLERADARVADGLPAIERLKWHLVRRRLVPELLEVLRFQREDLSSTPPVRVGRHWYGDYPFRGDRRLAIPDEVYRVDPELQLETRIDVLRRRDGRLVVEGHAFIEGVGAATRDAQRIDVRALRPGRWRRLRLHTTAARLTTTPVHLPQLTGDSGNRTNDVSWAGFEAVLDPRRLRRLGRWGEGAWELHVTVRAGGLTRRRSRFEVASARPLRAVDLPGDGETFVRASSSARRGDVSVHVLRAWAAIRGARQAEDGAMEVTGAIRPAPGPGAVLEAARRDGTETVSCPLEVDASGSVATFSARVPLAPIAAPLAADEPPPEAPWDLHVVAGETRRRVATAWEAPDEPWRAGAAEVVLSRTLLGEASLVARRPRAIVREARWTEDGVLLLRGEGPVAGPQEVVLISRRHVDRFAFPLEADAATGRFEARIDPRRTVSLAGVLPLREGRWELWAGPAGARDEDDLEPVMLGRSVVPELPLGAVVGHKRMLVGTTSGGRALLLSSRDLDDDERGPFHQRRLRTAAYLAHRDEPLRDAVVYASFDGRQCSDSPLAVYRELVRRGAPVEHLWVVQDGRCEAPGGVTVLREGSREHHEALATARWVVANDHFPAWFTRREDQVCLQTWHGVPLKRLGLEVPEFRQTNRGFQRRWNQQSTNWQYVVSPDPVSTPILRRAYAIEGEILETGLPRDDVLAAPGREERAAAVRRRLGLPEGAPVALYAPTYRDHVVDRRGLHPLDLQLDVERVRAALGPDAVLLFRRHHDVVGPVPEDPDGRVRDVSGYRDATELLLAADVLITDYSSILFDFAITGRPMLFHAHDLEAYAEEIRGFSIDFAATVPGPVLRTSEEVAAAIADLDAVRAAHAARYAAFQATFCALADGRATERVVDRVFGSLG